MIEILKATKEDLQTIHDMAQVVFRHTYRDILSPEQMDYMMEMMYSLPNLHQQLNEGHHYYIAYDGDAGLSDYAYADSCEVAGSGQMCGRDGRSSTYGMPCGYVSVQYHGADPDGTEVFHLHKIYVMPQSQGKGVGIRLFQTVMNHVRSVANSRVAVSSNSDAVSTGDPHPKARIELNVNKHNSAVAFYEHIGMRIIHEEDYPIGNGFYKTDYIMAMDLLCGV